MSFSRENDAKKGEKFNNLTEQTEEEEEELEEEIEQEEVAEQTGTASEVSKFSNLLLTTITEGGGDFAENVTLLNAVRGLFILQGASGVGIALADGFEKLESEDLNLATLGKILRENDDFFFAAYSFAAAITPKSAGNRGLISLLVAINNEKVYANEEEEKRKKYYDVRENIQDLIDKRIDKFNARKEELIADYKKNNNGDMESLQKLETKLMKHQQQTQKAIDELKMGLASNAAALQYFQSNRRLERFIEMTDIGLSTALFNFPPAYLSAVYVSLLMSETAELATFIGAKAYISNTAKANHGLREDPFIILGDEKSMEDAFNKKRQLKDICLILAPPIIQGKSVKNALNEIQKHARFNLVLPNKFSAIEDPPNKAKIETALRKLLDNTSYFLEFYKSYNELTYKPDFLNLDALQESLRDEAKNLIEVMMDKKTKIPSIEFKKYYDTYHKDLDLIIKGSLNPIIKLPISDEYLENLEREIFKDLEKCTSFINSLQGDPSLQGHQKVVNIDLLMKELQERIRSYNELNADREHNKHPLPINEAFIALQQIVKDKNQTPAPKTPLTLDEIEKNIFVTGAPGQTESLKDNQIAVTPERRAFGLTKKRQLEKQVENTLEELKETDPGTPFEIIINPYAEFKEKDIRNARDAKILRDNIEGLKTELQWINLLNDRLPDHIKIGNLDSLKNYYRNQIALINQSLAHIANTPPEPKGVSAFRKFISVLGTRITNYFRLPMAENELTKVRAQFGKLSLIKNESTRASAKANIGNSNRVMIKSMGSTGLHASRSMATSALHPEEAPIQKQKLTRSVSQAPIALDTLENKQAPSYEPKPIRPKFGRG